MRLYYCHVGSPHVDIEWDPEIVMDYRKRVQRISRITDDLLGVGADGASGPMDAWLEAALATHLRTARAALEAYDLRTAAGELVFAVPETLRWYQRRGGADGKLLRRVVRDWAAALCPMLPHLAEEMWARAGGEGLCSTAAFPDPAEGDPAALAAEEQLRAVLADVQTVRKLAEVEKPERLLLLTTPEWKRRLMARALELAEGDGRFPMGDLLKEAMADEAMRARGKAVQQFAGQLGKQVVQLSPRQRGFLAAGLDEARLLRDAADFIAEEVGVNRVEVFAADADDAPEHSKRSVASPLKPGIVLD
jgi:leucyl-tRNA synthetase